MANREGLIQEVRPAHLYKSKEYRGMVDLKLWVRKAPMLFSEWLRINEYEVVLRVGDKSKKGMDIEILRSYSTDPVDYPYWVIISYTNSYIKNVEDNIVMTELSDFLAFTREIHALTDMVNNARNFLDE